MGGQEAERTQRKKENPGGEWEKKVNKWGYPGKSPSCVVLTTNVVEEDFEGWGTGVE